MKYRTTRFKSPQIALKQLEPFVRDGAHLQTGKPFQRFGGLRSRELLANWLICVAVDEDRLTFTSDPFGGDGVVLDTLTGHASPMEHILVPTARGGEAEDVESRILTAIEKKRSKGKGAYASGKTLVVFLNAAGALWTPNRVARRLPEPLYFKDVWVVGLQGVEVGEYVYNVTCLDLSRGNAPIWRVHISKDFDMWNVQPVQ